MWCRDHHLACLIIDPLVSMANLHRETQSSGRRAGRSVAPPAGQASTEKTMNHDLVNVLVVVVKVEHPHTSWPCLTGRPSLEIKRFPSMLAYAPIPDILSDAVPAFTPPRTEIECCGLIVEEHSVVNVACTSNFNIQPLLKSLSTNCVVRCFDGPLMESMNPHDQWINCGRDVRSRNNELMDR